METTNRRNLEAFGTPVTAPCRQDGDWSNTVEVFNNTALVLGSLRSSYGTEWFKGVIDESGFFVPALDGHLGGNEDTARRRMASALGYHS